MFAVIDIETTGLSPERERITEIAVYITDGREVVEEFSTLIDPEKTIPAHITSLTGITNEMVEGAPKFYEIARRLVEMTEGKVFVAHNVHFDYGFVREEFRRLGYRYRRDLLDTVRESRRLVPGLPSYSLGPLCEALDIRIEDRHRAAGDALATVYLLHRLLALKEKKKISDGKVTLPESLQERIRQIPEEPGVYYFHNHAGGIIYIGKSRNLYRRVMSHFSGGRTRREMQIMQETADISWEETGSELVALLLESAEIKQHLPVYNRAQRRKGRQVGIFSHRDEKGYIRFSIRAIGEGETPLQSFVSVEQARNKLYRLMEKFDLCQKMTGLYEAQGACFYYQIGSCRGACVGEEPPAAYNMRAGKALRSFDFDSENFFILDRGRSAEERAVIKIEHGLPAGYGYIDINDHFFGTEPLHACIRPLPHYREMKPLIANYLKRKKVEKIIRF